MVQIKCVAGRCYCLGAAAQLSTTAAPRIAPAFEKMQKVPNVAWKIYRAMDAQLAALRRWHHIPYTGEFGVRQVCGINVGRK